MKTTKNPYLNIYNCKDLNDLNYCKELIEAKIKIYDFNKKRTPKNLLLKYGRVLSRIKNDYLN